MKGSPEERRRKLGRERVRRHEEQAWARRSGKVFTHRMDPTQLRAEQVAKALVEDPAILQLVKPDVAAVIRATLEQASRS